MLAKSHIYIKTEYFAYTWGLTQQELHLRGARHVSRKWSVSCPHHAIGKAKPKGGTDMSSLQFQNMIQPDGTSDNCPLQPGRAVFLQRTHQPSLSTQWEEIWAQREPQHPLAPIPSIPAQHHLPTVQAETRIRKQEDKQWSPAQHNPCTTETHEEGLQQI